MKGLRHQGPERPYVKNPSDEYSSCHSSQRFWNMLEDRNFLQAFLQVVHGTPPLPSGDPVATSNGAQVKEKVSGVLMYFSSWSSSQFFIVHILSWSLSQPRSSSIWNSKGHCVLLTFSSLPFHPAFHPLDLQTLGPSVFLQFHPVSGFTGRLSSLAQSCCPGPAFSLCSTHGLSLPPCLCVKLSLPQCHLSMSPFQIYTSTFSQKSSYEGQFLS